MENDGETLWRRYEFLDGLYRFYLEQIIGFHKFYLPVLGGIVTYNINSRADIAVFGFLIPLIISIGAFVIFFLGWEEAKELNNAIHEAANSVDIMPTHARILVIAVAAFSVLHFLITVALICVGGALLHFWHLPGLHEDFA